MCKFASGDAPGFRTVAAALRRYGKDAEAVVAERNEMAKRELGAKGWLEAKELVRGGAGWEGVRGIAGGSGGGVGALGVGGHDAVVSAEGLGTSSSYIT